MRYLRLWLAFLKMSWMADSEYRLNFVVRILGEAGWYLAQLSIFEVLYTHTKMISGWDVHAMRVFMATLFLVDSFHMILTMEGLEGMFSMIRKGELDMYLSKPIDSQFMVSFRKVATAYFFNILIILSYLIWAIHGLEQPVTPWQIVSYVVLVISGGVVQYGARFMFATMTVVLQDAGNIHFIWHQLYRLATRPDPIYPMFMRVFVFTLFPVAFFASVPSRILVDGIDPRLVVASLVFAVMTLFASKRFWTYALRQYSSASS
jgi:ABC-2 type transport system permease protein